jgi:hypothetical protein
MSDFYWFKKLISRFTNKNHVFNRISATLRSVKPKPKAQVDFNCPKKDKLLCHKELALQPCKNQKSLPGGLEKKRDNFTFVPLFQKLRRFEKH